jgi:phospholipid/cholesterol/gamma-HCH transport system substrate-binding protein
VALAIAGVLVVYVLLFSGSGGVRYRLLFENGGQLVKGNQVLVAGQPIGSVDSIALSPSAEAEVEVTVDHALHEGTTAVIRDTSLSGVANRYISVTPGPNNMPTLQGGATIRGDRTTAPVDLDQLFNTFNPRTRQGLRRVFAGQAAIYSGRGTQANNTYKYFAPALDATQRLLAEISSDQRTFTQFIVASGKVLTAIGERRSQLADLVTNSNDTLGAIASQNRALDRSLGALPPTLRQANTTFVNLRAALGDLTPLVNAAKPATKDLPRFLRNLRPVAARAVPVFGDLGIALRRPGPHNDLVAALRGLPTLESRAALATPRTIAGLDAAQPDVAFARPYSPDLAAFLTKFGEASAYYDANGHYFRVQPGDTGFFGYNATSGQLDPIAASQQYQGLDVGTFTRCPGGATQPIAGSNPFLDDGALLGKCDPSDVPPGP